MRGRRYDGTTVRRYFRAIIGAVLPPFRRTAVPSVLRQLAGMPDYAAHLQHLRRAHPGQPIPTEREFYEEFVRSRYGDSPSRCC